MKIQIGQVEQGCAERSVVVRPPIERYARNLLMGTAYASNIMFSDRRVVIKLGMALQTALFPCSITKHPAMSERYLNYWQLWTIIKQKVGNTFRDWNRSCAKCPPKCAIFECSILGTNYIQMRALVKCRSASH